MRVYYNEWDKYCAQWLRNLMAANLIPAGDVDERDIRDVKPSDLEGYDQCHFFAGIGGWAYALALAGWPDERGVWTGSCPCQRLSSAARGRNVAPDLWQAWFALIAASRPREILGEQVAHQRQWFDRACDDLEPLGYEIGAAVLPAISVGQDHARYRLFFVGHTNGDGKPSMPINGKASRLSRPESDAGGLVRSDGLSASMAACGPFGNAIIPQVAAQFIGAYLGDGDPGFAG